VTATPGDVNIIAIEKVTPENIGTAVVKFRRNGAERRSATSV